MPRTETLADRLRKAMRAADMSQKQLADAVGVKPPSVNGWLSSKARFIRGENLLKAAQALGVSEVWLATGKGDMHTVAGQPPLLGSTFDFQIMGIALKALDDYLSIIGRPHEYAYDAQLLQIAYSIVAERGEPVEKLADNVLDLTKRIAERMRREATDERSSLAASAAAFRLPRDGSGSN